MSFMIQTRRGEGGCLGGGVICLNGKRTLTSLLTRLDGVAVGVGVDYWVWKPDKDGLFSVKFCFSLLQNQCLLNGVLNREEEAVFQENWRGKAPGKMLAFSWTLLFDRIPTEVNLDKRRLMGTEDSKRCVFCDGDDESVVHLFLHCDVTSKVWRKLMCWLNFNFIMPLNLFIHALCWSREVRSKMLRRGMWLIWHAVVWVVWKTRNDQIFNNKIIGVEEMVDQIKALSWHWSLARLKIATCLLHEWCWNPRYCHGV